MKCDEAAEFVSRLCDGQVVPREVAKHIGTCEVCRARLSAYSAIGAELRRIASLEQPRALKETRWANRQRVPARWWRKGWQVMRVPRLVFAALVVVIVVLGSSLVMIKARARTQETVLMLTLKLPDGKSERCPLSIGNGNFAPCAGIGRGYFYQVRPIAKDGDRIEMGVRLGSFTPHDTPGVLTLDGLLNGVQEIQYWFEPGEELEIPFPGSGTVVITGEFIDHMPSLFPTEPDEPLDPKPGELRFVSPVLLRGKEVVGDLEGAGTTVNQENQGIEFYVPIEGLYHISLSPLKGGVKGRVRQSRVSFEWNGEAYAFLLAAPVTRSEHVWILLDANYRPSGNAVQHAFLGTADETRLLAKP